MFKKIIASALAHKAISTAIVLVVIVGGYETYQKLHGTATPTHYVLVKVGKGTISSYVSGTGQVSVSTQLDLKPKVSGDVIYVGVQDGQIIRAGTLIAQIDSSDAEKGVRDAQANLDSGHLSMQKLLQPADDLTILQAENSLAQAMESKKNAQDDLQKAYDDGFNSVAGAFFDISPTMTGLQDVLYGTTLSNTGGQSNVAYYADSVKNYDAKSLEYKSQAADAYATARSGYDINFQDYKSSTQFSDSATIEKLINETYETSKSVAAALKNSNTLIQFYQDKLVEHNIKPSALSDTHLSQLSTYTGKITSQVSSLYSIKNKIDSDKEAIINAERTIAEKTASLAKLKAGADTLDIQSQQLAVKQRENALLDAKDKLADYFIRAPFDSVVAKLNVKKGDSATPSTIIATIITKQQVAEISMNEVDVAKVKVGNKVTLTFDAVPDLNIAGQVAEIDAIGTMSQGVVSYMVKIGFATQDDRVKPGMTVSSTIITDTKVDVLTIPNSAVKSQNGASVVEIPDSSDVPTDITTAPITFSKPTTRQMIEVGISNDDSTEIISGLKEGDVVVGRTITTTTATAQTTQSSSALRIPGLTGGGARGGGGGFRGN